MAYLGQMLEKGGGYVVGIFPDGLVVSHNLLKLHIYSLLLCYQCLWKIYLNLGIPQIPISPGHTLCTTGRYGVFVRDM